MPVLPEDPKQTKQNIPAPSGQSAQKKPEKELKSTPQEKTPVPNSEAQARQQFVRQQKEIETKKNGNSWQSMVFRMQRGANDEAARQAMRSGSKMPWRIVYNALGQLLYQIGLQTEYLFVRFGRSLWWLCTFLAGVFVLFGRSIVVPALRFLRALWNDVTEPIFRVFSGLFHILGAMWGARSEGGMLKAGAAYFKDGVRTYRRMMLTGVSYLLPVGAAIILCVTVWSVVRTEFSLQVTYNDEVIGFVQNESVWESAQTLIRSRIKAADSTDEWSAKPLFNIVSVNTAARSNASQLADTIMQRSPETVQNAVGVYVDDVLIGVCADNTQVQQLLHQTLADAQAELPHARAEFLYNVVTVPGWYFTSSLVSFNRLRSDLVGGEYLRVKTIEEQIYEEPLAYEIVEQENEKYYQGTKRITQRGVNGRKQVTAEVVYLDGIEVDRIILAEEVLEEATPQIVQVGTKQLSSIGSVGQVGSGVLSFPVPNYSYITTRFGQGGHRGVDICAPSGTPIYACDSGVVTEAGWHYSWGYYVKIDHGNGMVTLYAHCSQLLVSAGTSVGRGQGIALVGNTGQSSGNHCHLELYINGILTNPLNYVSA